MKTFHRNVSTKEVDLLHWHTSHAVSARGDIPVDVEALYHGIRKEGAGESEITVTFHRK